MFTATATRQTQRKIIDMLNIDESQIIFIGKNPERANIKHCVKYVENDKDIQAIFNDSIADLQVYVPQNTTVPQNISLIYFQYKIWKKRATLFQGIYMNFGVN